MAINELEDEFRNFLVHKKGVLEDNIGWVTLPSDQPGREPKYALVIVDLIRNEYVAIFELKEHRDEVALRDAIEQLTECKRLLDKPQIPAYLILPPIETPNLDFEIRQVLEHGSTKKLPPADFPTYASLVSLDKTAEKQSQGRKIRAGMDEFKLICFILAALIVILFVLDATHVFSMSTQQLTLGGIALLLFLLPYAAKFKMLGIEFERNKSGVRASSDPS